MVNAANRDRDKGRDRDKDKDRGRGKGGFVYRERSTEDVKRRAEQKGGQFDSPIKQGIDTWRPKIGENEVRILPPSWDDHDHYGYDIWVHSFVGAEQSTFLCLKKMRDKPCACCEEANEARKAGESEEAKQLQAKKQVGVWIIDRDDRDENPQLWMMGWTLDREIAEQSRDKKRGKVLLIDHPDDGYDVTFRREGQGKKTKYVGVSVARESSPILEDERDQQKLLDFVQENSIPDLLVEHDYDYMAKALAGSSEKPDEDLDDKRGRGSRDKDGDEDDRRGSRRSRDEDKDDKGEEDRGSRRERSRDRGEEKDKGEEDRGSRRERSRDDDKGEEDGREERRERGRGREESDRGDDRGSRRSRDDDGDRDSDRSEGRSGRRSDRDDKDGDEGDDRRTSRRSRDDDSDDKQDRSSRRERSRDDDGDKGGEKDPPGERRGREETADEEDRGSRRGRGEREEKKDQDEDRPRRSRREK